MLQIVWLPEALDALNRVYFELHEDTVYIVQIWHGRENRPA